MSETCDRCGPTVRALYGARRDGELYLCRHCAKRLRAALSAQGWAIWLIGDRDPVTAPHATRHLFSWRKAS